uniref:Alpha-1,6-mannosyl-glycoprotein 6-beta-N-acetylglucosaminyltransferase n=1 Tax=Heligmosomoides polygyrus TaxID=6339 RepID=A0A183G640_HELPZ
LNTSCAQNSLYFQDYLPHIRRLLTFSYQIRTQTEVIVARYGENFTNSMCVHNRQTDFADLKWAAGINDTFNATVRVAQQHVRLPRDVRLRKLELILHRGAARASGNYQPTSELAKLCRAAKDLKERRVNVLAEAAEAGLSIRYARRKFSNFKTKITAPRCPDGTVTSSRRTMEKVIHDFYCDLFDSHVHLPTMPPSARWMPCALCSPFRDPTHDLDDDEPYSTRFRQHHYMKNHPPALTRRSFSEASCRSAAFHLTVVSGRPPGPSCCTRRETCRTLTTIATLPNLTRYFLFGDDQAYLNQLASMLNEFDGSGEKVAEFSTSSLFEDFYLASRMCSAFLMSSAMSTSGWWMAFFTRDQHSAYMESAALTTSTWRS